MAGKFSPVIEGLSQASFQLAGVARGQYSPSQGRISAVDNLMGNTQGLDPQAIKNNAARAVGASDEKALPLLIPFIVSTLGGFAGELASQGLVGWVKEITGNIGDSKDVANESDAALDAVCKVDDQACAGCTEVMNKLCAVITQLCAQLTAMNPIEAPGEFSACVKQGAGIIEGALSAVEGICTERDTAISGCLDKLIAEGESKCAVTPPVEPASCPGAAPAPPQAPPAAEPTLPAAPPTAPVMREPETPPAHRVPEQPLETKPPCPPNPGTQPISSPPTSATGLNNIPGDVLKTADGIAQAAAKLVVAGGAQVIAGLEGMAAAVTETVSVPLEPQLPPVEECPPAPVPEPVPECPPVSPAEQPAPPPCPEPVAPPAETTPPVVPEPEPVSPSWEQEIPPDQPAPPPEVPECLPPDPAGQPSSITVNPESQVNLRRAGSF